MLLQENMLSKISIMMTLLICWYRKRKQIWLQHHMRSHQNIHREVQVVGGIALEALILDPLFKMICVRYSRKQDGRSVDQCMVQGGHSRADFYLVLIFLLIDYRMLLRHHRHLEDTEDHHGLRLLDGAAIIWDTRMLIVSGLWNAR